MVRGFYKKGFVVILLLCFNLSLNAKEKKELILYTGITMVKPVQEVVHNFEKKYDCKIKVIQGASQDLYDIIKMSKVGDIYLPGNAFIRYKNMKDGLFLDGRFVGYNKLALIVKKGNPKNIKASLNELTNENLRVAIGDNYSGSIGRTSKKVLIKEKIYKKVMLNTSLLAPDSRTLTKLIIDDKVDLLLNWYATIFFNENKKYIQVLELDDKYAQKSKLVFNLLSTSKNKRLSRKFLDFAASKESRKIFYKYGFLDDKDLEEFDKVKF